MKIKPLHDRVLVRRADAAGVSKGGIIIPDGAKEKPAEGIVVSVGSGKRLEDGTLVPIDVKPGDRVLYLKYSGSEVKLPDEDGEHMILRDDDILAVIDVLDAKA